MYDSSLLMLLSWPAIIIISYVAVRIVLHLYEKKQAKPDPDPDQEVASEYP